MVLDEIKLKSKLSLEMKKIQNALFAIKQSLYDMGPTHHIVKLEPYSDSKQIGLRLDTVTTWNPPPPTPHTKILV